MREILFRGKTKVIAGSPYNNGKADGEWVRGYLYNDVGCYKIRQFETDYADYIPYEVDPETIGQYTGLTDKNGNKIFEGDIVKAEIDGGPYDKFVFPVGVTVFENGCFGKKERNNFTPFSSYAPRVSFEVIGNIHDNPELLKEGAE